MSISIGLHYPYHSKYTFFVPIKASFREVHSKLEYVFAWKIVLLASFSLEILLEMCFLLIY
jgi:hypothetical protein